MNILKKLLEDMKEPTNAILPLENETNLLRIEVPNNLEIVAKRNGNSSVVLVSIECEYGKEYEMIEKLYPLLKTALVKKTTHNEYPETLSEKMKLQL